MARRWMEAVEGASTLIDILARRARLQGSDTAFTFLADGEDVAETLDFAALDARARSVAAGLRQIAQPGSRALMLYPSGLDYVVAFLGCLYARVIAVPAYPPASKRHLPRLHAIARDARPAVVLSDSDTMPRLRAAASTLPSLEKVAWLATDSLPPASGDGDDTVPSAEEIAFLQYTSGSTAAPKGVMVTHANLLHNEHVIQRQTGHSEETVFVGWLPLYHDMGLIGNVLQPLYLGIPCVLMSPVAFLQKPSRWLHAISRFRGTTSGGPNVGYELSIRRFTDEQKEGLDLSSWSLAFSGAEPVRADTLERFATAFAPCGFRREALYPCYGMAETTLMITGGAPDAVPVVRDLAAEALEENRAEDPAPSTAMRRVVGCGKAGADFEIVIADPQSGRRLDDRLVGEIWVASPSVAQGYWNLFEVTEETFGARLALSGEIGGENTGDESDRGPYLRTGDLGFLDGGELFVTGRMKDLIIIRGRNHYPQDIETSVERSHPAVRPGCAIAVSADVDGEERLVVVAEVDRHSKDDPEIVADAIRRAVAATHQVQVYDVLLIRTGTLPKTSSGKLQRQAALSEYRAGTLAVTSRSTLEAAASDEVMGAELELDRDALRTRGRRRPLLESFLRDRLARLTGTAAAYVDPDRPLTSMGLDSLVAVELRNVVESRLGVDVPLAQLLEGPTIAELTSTVLAQIDAPGADERPRLAAGDPDSQREHPLSYGQQALWYLQRLAPQHTAYNIRGAARLDGELDVDALRHAAAVLVERHGALRTRFVERSGEPRAMVGDEPTFDFDVHDATALDPDVLRERLSRDVHRPFDLEQGPVLRFGLYLLAPRQHLLVVVVHHTVADFWSLGILVRELGMLYGAYTGGPAAELDDLPLTYSDFVTWQRAVLASGEGERLRAYWQKRLAGDPAILDLPCDRPRPTVQTFSGDSCAAQIEPDVAAQLHRLGAEHGATLFMTLMATYQSVIHRWSAQDDVLVGSPTTLRGAPELAPIVGYFVNPVVIRGDLSDARKLAFADFLDQIRQTTLGAFAHQEYPFPVLVEDLGIPHDASRSPLFQVLFVWQKDRLPEEEGLAAFALGEEGAEIALGPLEARSVKLPDATAQFDLSLDMAEVGGRLTSSLRFNTDLFDTATAERLLGHLTTALAAVAAAPQTLVAHLPILTVAERRQLVDEWNPEPRRLETVCLHELFAEQATRTPDAEALIDGARRFTYGQIDRAANRVAHELRQLGIGPEVGAGVCMERRAEMIVALLAVLKAGGAYVPLDPAYPSARLAFTLGDSRLRVLLVHGGAPPNLPASDAARIDLAGCLSGDGDESPGAPSSGVSSRNLAYLIYTSGSTGRPKGVAITHASATTMVRWAAAAYSRDELDGVLASTSICFDLSVFEIFVPLCHGGRVILALNALELPRLEAAAEVRLINTVPSAMRQLAEDELPRSVGVVNLAGEPLPGELVARIYEHPGVKRVMNLYGPSEDTTYSTFTHVRHDDSRPPSIGRGIDGTQVYLVDRSLNLVPRGVTGELVLGGAGLARGYLGRIVATAERFVPEPYSGLPDARLYRTGDLARYRGDGELEFLGRMDHQIKVRGFRIELGEIEAAIKADELVKNAVVIAREDQPGDQQIVAYVVPRTSLYGEPLPKKLDLRELRDSLAATLPAFMMPQAMIELETLPLLPNGKIDRAGLPVPDMKPAAIQDDFVAPETEVEEMLAAMWREVLGVEKIGINDSFFDLGGHSLKATRVLARVRDEFGVDLPIRSLLEAPTIAGLQEAIAAVLMEEAGEEAVAEALAEIEDGA